MKFLVAAVFLSCSFWSVAHCLELENDNLEALGQECFGSRARCNETDHVTMVQRGYWAGPYDIGNETITVLGFCAFCNFQNYKIGHLIKIDLDNQCDENRNQSSMLCSSCKKGYSFAINSYRYECVKCRKTSKGERLYFTLNVLILTVFLLFIYLFDFSLVSGALNPLIFFGQMTSTTLNLNMYEAIPTNNLTESLSYAYQTINSFWKLDLMFSGNNLCLHEDMTIVQILSLKYIIALMALSPVIVLVLIAKSLDKISNSIGKGLRRLGLSEDLVIHIINPCKCFGRFPWIQRAIRFNRDNSIQTIVSSCILLSFIKFNIITFYLLTPTNLYNIKGTVVGKALFYDGSLSYPGSKTLWMYAWLAVVFLIAVIIIFPFTLIFLRYDLKKKQSNPSIKCGHILSYLDKFLDKCILTPFQRDLRSGNKPEDVCSKIKLWRLSFGMHDCRWYAGWYFVLRSSLFAISIFSMDYLSQLIIQQILIIIALGITVMVRPYRQMAHNRLDAFVFLLILIINSSVLFQYHLTILGNGAKNDVFVVQYCLSFIPTILIIAYFFMKIRRNWRIGRDYHLIQNEKNVNFSSTECLERFLCGCTEEHENMTYAGQS